jgi:hypothetical protein
MNEILIASLILGIGYFADRIFRSYHFPRKAAKDISYIYEGIRKFGLHYGRLPISDSESDEQDTAIVLRVLTGLRSSSNIIFLEESLLSKLNPDFVNFIPDLMGRKMVDGALVDPWGEPYRIALDRDLDGDIDMIETFADTLSGISNDGIIVDRNAERIIGVKIHKTIAVWSCGPDRKNDFGSGDDLTSWKN